MNKWTGTDLISSLMRPPLVRYPDWAAKVHLPIIGFPVKFRILGII